jgi:hypothetical protein
LNFVATLQPGKVLRSRISRGVAQDKVSILTAFLIPEKGGKKPKPL